MSNPNELKTIGLKATLPRLKILEIFQSSGHRHMSAEDVYKQLLTSNMDIGLATVYNTLNLFAAKGLLRALQVDPARGLFDSNMRPHFHIHVENTGELIDVPPGDIEFSRLPPLPPGTESVAVEVVIRVRRQGT